MNFLPDRRLRHALLGSVPFLFAAASAQTVENIAVKGKTATQQAAAKPAAIAVISAQNIADNNARTVESIAAQTPSLVIPVGPSNSSAWNFIRGIGEVDPQGDQTVGVYVDGVALPRSLGGNQQLLDVNGVEIDRGPVGFDGGRNSEGGGLRIATTVPGNATHIALEGGYGSLNEQEESAAVSGAIIPDLLFASISADHHQRDGNVTQIGTGLKENNINDSAGRAKLRYTPGDDLDITLSVDGTNDSGTARAYTNLLAPLKNVEYNPIFPQSQLDQGGATLDAKYAVADSLSLESITSEHQFRQAAYYDNNSDPWARISQLLIYKDKTASQEFRLSGNYGRYDFVTGIYADYEDWFTDRRANNNNGTYNVATASGSNVSLSPVEAVIHQINTSAAIFGQGHYLITPALKLTAGFRAGYEGHSSGETLYALGTQAGGAANIAALEYGPRLGQDWHVQNGHAFRTFQPEIGLDYHLNANLDPYVSFKRGEKQGGYDFRSQLNSAAGIIQASKYYNPEFDNVYEVGLKTNWFNGRIIASADGFYNDFSNIQLTTTDPTTGTSHRFNAGNGHSEGFEFDAKAQITPVWQVEAEGSVENAYLDHFNGVQSYSTALGLWLTPRAGATLPYVPKFSGNLSTSYILPIPTTGEWRLWGNVNAQSNHFSDVTDYQQQKIEGVAIFDTALGYTTPDGRLNFKLTIKNLLDKRYYTALSYTPSTNAATLGQAAIYSGVENDARSAFFSVKYTY